jgi:multidrug efflux pump subunit AcrA (membrane-fusion protein)
VPVFPESIQGGNLTAVQLELQTIYTIRKLNTTLAKNKNIISIGKARVFFTDFRFALFKNASTHKKIEMKPYSTIFFSLSLFLVFGCSQSTETISPTKSNITESVYAAGIVKSNQQYEVFAELNGKIETIFVKEGDFVQKGTPLFQLENNSTKLSTKNALATAFSNDYQRNKTKLLEAQNSIELAQKKVTNDSISLLRQQSLWKQNIGAKIELEQQELSYENAKANLKKAKVLYEDLNQQLKLASEQSKNNLKIAQSTENNLIIRSELDGVVYKINAKKGEFASGTKPLAVLGKRDFVIEFNVDELDIVKIKNGQKVMVRMDSYKDQVFEATISFIYPMMDERKRAFRVEALFTKAPKVLYPNLSLEVNILINEKTKVLTIPSSYLVNDTAVMLEDGTLRAIKTGLKDFNTVEVLGGIDEHTKIKLPKE